MILVEHGPGGEPAVFDGAREVVVARTLDEVPGALRRLDAARAAGAWVAGYVAYEAGYAFEPRLCRWCQRGRGRWWRWGCLTGLCRRRRCWPR